MKFRWLDTKTEADVFGGRVDEDHSAFLTIEKFLDGKDPKKLQVGETCHVQCRSSSEVNTYQITRVE